MKNFAIAMSETGCETVVCANDVSDAVEKSGIVVRYSSEFSEWPEYDLLKTLWKENKYTIKENEHAKKFLERYGRDDGGYPMLIGELVVIFPKNSDQFVYIYETSHPACERYDS